MVDGPLAAETPVLIASGEETPADCELLLNLGGECPPHFERFTRLFEVVSSSEEDKANGRAPLSLLPGARLQDRQPRPRAKQ